MKKTLSLLLGILFFSVPLFAQQIYPPCDKLATNETRELYASMQRLVGAGTLFGHHDDTAYGVGWKGDDNRSDVKSVAGSYPALYEWDFAKMEHKRDSDINGIPFKTQRKLVREAYDRGGINEFCWHMDNPANGKSAWDTSMRTVADIIPGGAHHDNYVHYLDNIANYAQTLKGPNGEAIPILFRPFHELTGNWFWWCRNTCTPDEFKTLWRFTIDYLRNEKHLHNLVIVYSVADFNTKADFLERYPGDDYVDVVGFDNYCTNSVNAYKHNLDKRMGLQLEIAHEHHKLACLAETGYQGIPQADWWTSVLLPALKKYPQTSFVLVWRNWKTSHFYAPYPGQVSADDFKQFSLDGQTMFQNRLSTLGVYGKYITPNHN
jgi:mannan endo-1,4-beta-mannosidase